MQFSFVTRIYNNFAVEYNKVHDKTKKYDNNRLAGTNNDIAMKKMKTNSRQVCVSS